MGDSAISARTMALAARYDPQFSVPERPRLRRGLVIRRDRDRLVVDGTPTRHTLRGKAATELVPRLLARLDGIADRATLAGDLGVGEETVFAALSLLWTTGLIEDEAPAGIDVSGVPEHLADFLSRIGDATQANPAWEQAADRLARARVQVRGDSGIVAALADALAGTLAVEPATGDGAGASLVVLARTGGPLAADRRLIDACWARGTPLLLIHADEEHVEVGPYADRALGPCLDCLIASHPAGDGDPTEDPDPADDSVSTDGPDVPGDLDAVGGPDPIGGPDPGGDLDRAGGLDPDGAGVGRPDAVALAAGLAAADIVALVGRASRIGLPTRWRRIHLVRLSHATRTGATRPGCPACSTATAPTPSPATTPDLAPTPDAPPPPEVAPMPDAVPAVAPTPGAAPSLTLRAAPLSARYEAAVALPPREYADLKSHQMHYQPANVALQRGHKTWPVAPRVPLPAPDLDRLGVSVPAAPDRLGVADLATLLAVAAGWQRETDDRVWRWSATGGNIGSVVAHLLVRDVDRLDAGVYGYVPSVHRLALLRPGPPPDCPPGCASPVCLLLTADLARVASKYSAFGLRVVLLDAGCAHTAVLEAAEALGIEAIAGIDLADEVMSDALGTDLDAEPVTGLIHLSTVDGGAR